MSAALRRPIATTLLPGFSGTTLPDWLAERLRGGLGGVCLFGQNVASTEQLRLLTDAIREAHPAAVIAIDEEGGDVTRLHQETGSPYPGNAILGRIDDPSFTEEVARLVGTELRSVGCTVAFAPVVDVNSNPDNPVIGVRSFGSAPESVAIHGAAWVRGLQSTGVAATAKHFPGHGDTELDSHLSMPVVERSLDQLRRRELAPFATAITAGVRAIMTSHILLPAIDAERPATHSPAVLTLLRSELGFDGVIVSDALDMVGASGTIGVPEAAVRALAAGCDLLCIGTENTDAQLREIEEAILAAINEGRLSDARLAEAASRVRALSAHVDNTAPRPDATAPADGQLRVNTARIIDAFDIAPAAEGLIARLADGEAYSVVRIETVANLAVGSAPWGPFAEPGESPATPHARAFGAAPCVTLRAGGHVGLLPADGAILVVGKDIHRHVFACEAVDELRAARDDVLVIDLGWPSDDRRYADIATFGASRLVGRALLALLAGERE